MNVETSQLLQSEVAAHHACLRGSVNTLHRHMNLAA